MPVVVTPLGELDGLDRARGLEGGHAFLDGGVDHIEKALLEVEPLTIRASAWRS